MARAGDENLVVMPFSLEKSQQDAKAPRNTKALLCATLSLGGCVAILLDAGVTRTLREMPGNSSSTTSEERFIKTLGNNRGI